MRAKLAALCGFAAVAMAIATPLAGGALRPGYLHLTQFISELGEMGAEHGAQISAFGFAPTGVLVLLFLALAAPSLPRTRRATLGLLAFAAVGVAYLVAAVARCDAGCPSTGSPSQTVHNLFGALEYVGAVAGLLLLASAFDASPTWRSMAPATVVCAVLVGVGFGLLLVPSLLPLRGLLQRVAEVGVFGWIALTSVALLRDKVDAQSS